ncbi:MAG: type III glutamate--ammonia ligase, partial [Bacillota bacterium]
MMKENKGLKTEDETIEKWEQKKQSLINSGVEFCLASYVDIHGSLKAKVIPIVQFEKMMRGSELFTGAALDGFPGQEVNSDEISVHPDLESIMLLPWADGMALAPGSLFYLGEPYSYCSRNVLKRQIERAANKGFIFKLGIEAEFYLVQFEGDQLVPANKKDHLAKAAYDVPTLLDYSSFFKEVFNNMEKLGWKLNDYDHEDANSQFEIDWEPNECLITSDRYSLFKMMLKAIAEKYDTIATFMAKPFGNRTGTGAHYNMSLIDKDTGANLFEDPEHEYNLSQLGHWFIGGILKHARAIAAVSAPTVNSYKRLIKGGSITGYTWAPIYCTFGRNNRTNMIRVPSMGGRIECRTADGMCNPYLATAMFLAAGLEGIEKKIDPGPNYEINLYALSE